MDVETRFTPTESLLRAAERRHRACRLSWLWLAVIIVLDAVVLLVLWLSSAPGILFWLFVGWLAAEPLVILWAERAALRMRCPQFAVRFGRPVCVHVGDTGLTMEGPSGCSELRWARIERLRRFPDVWLLFPRGAPVWVLPASSLRGGLAEFIAEKARQHGGKVR